MKLERIECLKAFFRCKIGIGLSLALVDQSMLPS